MEENVPQMMINLLVMILLAITQFFEGRQNDWTTRMDYLRKIQVCHMLWYKTDHVHYSSTTSCSPTVWTTNASHFIITLFISPLSRLHTISQQRKEIIFDAFVVQTFREHVGVVAELPCVFQHNF